jgi:hypothetical protein
LLGSCSGFSAHIGTRLSEHPLSTTAKQGDPRCTRNAVYAQRPTFLSPANDVNPPERLLRGLTGHSVQRTTLNVNKTPAYSPTWPPSGNQEHELADTRDCQLNLPPIRLTCGSGCTAYALVPAYQQQGSDDNFLSLFQLRVPGRLLTWAGSGWFARSGRLSRWILLDVLITFDVSLLDRCSQITDRATS